ncbi:MAG: GNAT family N-acetyltransferase [Chloroflexi bacterium]|nr:GNAT family N-acetyltransferase [Chloroflexota bacterium]
MELITLGSHWLPSLYTLIQCTAYERRLDLDELRHRIWDDMSMLPELQLGAVVDGHLAGFCLGCIREGRGVVMLFGVAPEFRRRGIATALFKELEARFSAYGITQAMVEGIGPGYYWPGVELGRGESLAFLFKQGYETDRVARVDMLVDLRTANLATASVIKALADTGVQVRRATQEDIPATAAFALQHFSRGWQLEVEEAKRFPNPPVNIALANDAIVGFAVYDVTGYGRFGPTGTRPDMRKRGIGAVLLKECCRQMRERGDATAEIAWAGPVSFYLKEVGAQIHRAYWGFRKNISSRPTA